MSAQKSAYLFLSSLLLLSACSSDQTEPGDGVNSVDLGIVKDLSARPDIDMTTTQPPEDMSSGQVDMSSDMTVAVEDMAPEPEDMWMQEDTGASMQEDMAKPVVPLRSVVEHKMMGDLPLQNYVSDPMFDDLNVGQSWFCVTPQGLRKAWRHVRTKTPLNAPAVRIARQGLPDNTSLFGIVLFPFKTTMSASIWVGHPNVAGQPPANMTRAYVMGFSAQNPYMRSRAVLSEVSGSEVELDGIRWVKYEGMIPNLVGYGNFHVDDSSTSDVFIHAPVLLPSVIPQYGGESPRLSWAKRAVLSPAEEQKYKVFEEALKRAKERAPKPEGWKQPHLFNAF